MNIYNRLVDFAYYLNLCCAGFFIFGGIAADYQNYIYLGGFNLMIAFLLWKVRRKRNQKD